MLQDILKLNGVQKVNKQQQKSIRGGDIPILVEEHPCGDTGGRINPSTNPLFCKQVGGVWLGDGKCMICH